MYDINYIFNYIESRKSEICCVLCGYIEAWIQSASVVFCNGNYIQAISQLNSRPKGKTRTPYMEVIFNDGTISFLQCFTF